MSPSSYSELSQRLGIPSTKIPIDSVTFVSYVLPPVVCYFVIAALAVTPKMRAVRVASWPVVALLALRAALSVDVSLGNPEHGFYNTGLVLYMFSIATQTLGWTLAKNPLVRHLRPVNSSPSAVMDVLDLAINLRGHGWSWARGVYIPRETRPTTRIGFIFYTFLSAVVHALICGALHRAILAFASVGTGTLSEGTSIFDETLPFLVRYLRAGIMTTLTAFMIYALLQMGYDLSAITGILIFGQDPAQWPPAFDAPWRATSIGDFWGCRWHQWYRHMFLLLGGYPLSFIFGRAGIVVGTFLLSAVVHHMVMLTFDSQAECWRMLVGFGMMAPAILAEQGFHRWTGRKVGGVTGWVWTMTWLLVWGSVMVEGFARAGIFGCSSFIDSASPLRVTVEQLVTDFDAWLHVV